LPHYQRQLTSSEVALVSPRSKEAWASSRLIRPRSRSSTRRRERASRVAGHYFDTVDPEFDQLIASAQLRK
jgi:hypothetical protein